jgi:hypothetical protein
MEEQPVSQAEATESRETSQNPARAKTALAVHAPASGEKRVRATKRWIDGVIALAIFCVTIAIGLLFAVHYSMLSPLDEHAHFDYIYKITQGRLSPRPGSIISDETLKEMKCRPSIVYPDANCSRVQTAIQTPVKGVNYVLIYGETYYLPAALITKVVHDITAKSWLMSARAASALFYALGAAALYLVARVYRAPRAAAAGMVLAFSGCSMVFAQAGTVTPDSMAPLAGAAAALVPSLKIPWWWRMAVAVVVGVMIAFIKPNLVPLGCLVVLLAGIMPANDDVPFSLSRILLRAKTLAALALAVIPLVLALVWNVWENSRLPAGVRADGGLSDILLYNGPFSELLFSSAQGMLNPLSMPPMVPSTALATLSTLMASVILGGSLMIALNTGSDRRPRLKTMTIGGLMGVLLTAIYVPLVLYVTYHASGTQGRYVIPLYALLLAPVAASFTGRVARWVPLVLGALTVVAAFTAIVAIH